MKERIDKILAVNMNIARSEVKKLIKNGAVAINGITVKDGGEKCDISCDGVTVYGKKLKDFYGDSFYEEGSIINGKLYVRAKINDSIIVDTEDE